MLICEITGIKISRKTEAAPEKTIFTQTTFSLFIKKKEIQGTKRNLIFQCRKGGSHQSGGDREVAVDGATNFGKSSSPTLFNLFSAKAGPQPTVNFFLEENRNLWLYRRVNNEENRNRRRAFADFQELRQNDLLRFHELMITQNEQIKATTLKQLLRSSCVGGSYVEVAV
ncbi:conserved Plasmodium protein, unknown function [Plasmodium ovale curtisi]|uniref:Uncharacterized protein n=1 Tax=Plasmodium ovale curtisi TaxID=864141 RepID=A0A1A8W122_PLAOA|nr:conserved Plasmodium protein, unknown function [Plasmodium ovale curtisi]SBS96883.1 conserved Plasmodium protein, unknown function [Plasmodium ovale curtisi]